MIVKRFLLFFLSAFLLNGCIKNNPDPAWLEINEWSLVANPNLNNQEGYLSHSFTDAWVYVDDVLLGVFELPCKVPVIKSGSVNIKIYPTIRENGISSTKARYPFVNYYELTTNLVENETLTINPITSYKSSVTFWKEDFEASSVKITTSSGYNTTLSVENDPSILKYGSYYGIIRVNETDTAWSGYSETLQLSTGVETYLEIDYYNTNQLLQSVLGTNTSSVTTTYANILLNPQDPSTVKWKKIYINLKEIVSYSGDSYFSQLFQVILDTGDTEGFVVIDNVKIVHF